MLISDLQIQELQCIVMHFPLHLDYEKAAHRGAGPVIEQMCSHPVRQEEEKKKGFEGHCSLISLCWLLFVNLIQDSVPWEEDTLIEKLPCGCVYGSVLVVIPLA